MSKTVKYVIVLDGFVKCPLCKSGLYCPCTTPKGKELRRPHEVRMKLAESKGLMVKGEHKRRR